MVCFRFHKQRSHLWSWRRTYAKWLWKWSIMLLCVGHWSRAQCRRTVSFYVYITFFQHIQSKQVEHCGKENKVQDTAPNIPRSLQICKLVMKEAACCSDVGISYLCVKYHARNVPKSDCAVKLQHDFWRWALWHLQVLGITGCWRPPSKQSLGSSSGGDRQRGLSPELASILGLSVPFRCVPPATAGGCAKGILMLGLGSHKVASSRSRLPAIPCPS